jgi:Zn-dependent protease/CBS domain-containing protein
MFGSRRRLFRLLGIPVAVDASWLIVLALLTLTLAGAFPGLMKAYYPGVAPRQPPWVYWLMGLLAALAFFGCILLHELGHAVAARSRRMPIRGITLFLFGGVAEIGDEPPSPRAELLMAVAGPAVSVALAALLGTLAWLGYRLGWPPQAVLVLGYLAGVNALVLTFNLVPAFPLDGGRVLRSILWAATGSLRRATYWAALAGQGFAWALILWGVLNFFAGNWLGGVWIGLIGLFLANAAQAGYQQVLVRKALEGEPVRRFMNPDPVSVPPSLDLRSWVEDYVYRHHRKAFPVVAEGTLEGLIETRSLARVPRGEWGRHTVGEVMRRDLGAITVAPGADAVEALGRMQRSGSGRLLVAEGGRLVGIITLKDLLRFLSLKIELEGLDEGRPGPAPGRHEADGKIPAESFLPAHR